MPAVYLVEISPAEGATGNLNDIIASVEKIVVKHTNTDTLRFKVFGENRIGFIAQGDEPQKVLQDLNNSVGGAVRMKTIPLRCYEPFAESVLGVDKSLGVPNTKPFQKPQRLFYARATIDFQGVGLEEFLKIFKEEAESALGDRARGKIDFRIFKTIASRNVLLLLNIPEPEILDGWMVKLPFATSRATTSGFTFPTVLELTAF